MTIKLSCCYVVLYLHAFDKQLFDEYPVTIAYSEQTTDKMASTMIIKLPSQTCIEVGFDSFFGQPPCAV